MAPKKPLTLNGQLALLDDPAPRGTLPTVSSFTTADESALDFDPEGLDDEFSADEEATSNAGSGDGSEEEREDAGADGAREHYVAVGKSALRKKGALVLAPLGKEYEGARVSRDKLYDSEDEKGDEGDEEEEEEEGGVGIEDVKEGDIKFGVDSDDDEEIDSDDALGSDGGEEGRFSAWKFSGSATAKGGVVPKRGDKVVGSDSEDEGEEDDDEEKGEEESESAEDDDESDNESQSDDEGEGSEGEDEGEDEDEEEEEKRQALSKMMAEEKKYCLSFILYFCCLTS